MASVSGSAEAAECLGSHFVSERDKGRVNKHPETTEQYPERNEYYFVGSGHIKFQRGYGLYKFSGVGGILRMEFEKDARIHSSTTSTLSISLQPKCKAKQTTIQTTDHHFHFVIPPQPLCRYNNCPSVS